MHPLKAPMPTSTAIILFALLLPTACGGSVQEPADEGGIIYEGSWRRGWPNLGHDGNPYESNRFIVFSEAASLQARQQVAAVAEASLDAIMEKMDIDASDFTFLPSYEKPKIHILADYDQQAQSGLAYRDGVIVRAPDSPRYRAVGYTPESYRSLLQHEVFHVVEFLLIGDPTYQQANDVWLREGFASYAADIHHVQTVEELDAWRERMQNVPGGGNPIGIHVWSNFPQSVIASNSTIDYYRYFELAVRYLQDPIGLSRTVEDHKALFEDLGNGVPFGTAFQRHYGLQLNVFQAEYWDRIRAYLGAKAARAGN